MERGECRRRGGKRMWEKKCIEDNLREIKGVDNYKEKEEMRLKKKRR
jgi:hypothetical protein